MNNSIAVIDRDLSFASMKKSNPTQHGKVLKLHFPLLWNIIPSFLQQLIRYCTSRIIPSWKKWKLIILGNYIDRFYDKSSRSMKGSPIALDEIDACFVTKRTNWTTSTPNYSYQELNLGGGAVEDLETCHRSATRCSLHWRSGRRGSTLWWPRRRRLRGWTQYGKDSRSVLRGR